MANKIVRLFKDPRVRQVLTWVTPIIFGWLFDRSKNSRKSVVSKRK